MQIVIDIDDNLYTRLFDNGVDNYDDAVDMAKSIRKGTPLPKGHGKIVDISKIDNDRIESDNPVIYLTINGEYIEAVSLDYLNSLPTIIKADKAESEEDKK